MTLSADSSSIARSSSSSGATEATSSLPWLSVECVMAGTSLLPLGVTVRGVLLKLRAQPCPHKGTVLTWAEYSYSAQVHGGPTEARPAALKLHEVLYPFDVARSLDDNGRVPASTGGVPTRGRPVCHRRRSGLILGSRRGGHAQRRLATVCHNVLAWRLLGYLSRCR